jgi:hypothetical protein
MQRRHTIFTPPRGRSEWTWIRSGHDGTYWQAADGLVVRLAAAERAAQSTRTRIEPRTLHGAERPAAAVGGIARGLGRALALVFGRRAATGQWQ